MPNADALNADPFEYFGGGPRHRGTLRSVRMELPVRIFFGCRARKALVNKKFQLEDGIEGIRFRYDKMTVGL